MPEAKVTFTDVWLQDIPPGETRTFQHNLGTKLVGCVGRISRLDTIVVPPVEIGTSPAWAARAFEGMIAPLDYSTPDENTLDVTNYDVYTIRMEITLFRLDPR